MMTSNSFVRSFKNWKPSPMCVLTAGCYTSQKSDLTGVAAQRHVKVSRDKPGSRPTFLAGTSWTDE